MCSEQSLSVPEEKARELVDLGVRRVFCIVVGGPGRKRRRRLEKSYVAEWSPETESWSPIPETGTIEDDCLATPMPVKALLDATLSDDAVVDALEARGNHAIRKLQAKAQAKGEAKGRAATLVSIFEARGLALADEARQRIPGCRDSTLLTSWTRRALSIDSVDDLWSD